MFNENNEKWIKAYKAITVTFFWLWLAFGLYAFIDNMWIGDIFYVEIGYNGYFLGSVVLLLAGFLTGYIQLVTNMLVIQLLNNVQVIREKLENN